MGIKKLFSGSDTEANKNVTTIPGKASKTLAQVLRITGDKAFSIPDHELEDIQRTFSAWAENVLTGESPDGESENGLRRWDDLLVFFEEHRGHELAFVEAGMQNLRHLFWQFARIVAENLTQDRIADLTIGEQLERLREAVGTDSIDKLRQEAQSTIEVLENLTNNRQKRHREQLRELGKKLRQMRFELESARRALVLDPLTQLYNRKALDQHIVRIADLSIFSGKAACIMMLDIDHFKNINDTYGHTAGDSVIRLVGKMLIDNFPRKTDFVARYGGEEFTIILQEDGMDVATVLAERILDKIAKATFPHKDLKLHVTCSIGLAELIPGEKSSRWIERADSALYDAKRDGRNCFKTST